MSVHDSIDNVFAKLGYAKAEGCCHGFTLRWLEAVLSDNETVFNGYVNSICENENTIVEQINEAKKKKGVNLTQQQSNALTIGAFYDSLKLYHSPEKHALLLNRPLNQNNIEELSYFASSEKVTERGGLKNLYSYPGIYTEQELQAYLDNLRLHIEQSNPAVEKPLGFILSSSNHTIGLVYQPQIGWLFMDINQFPAKNFLLNQTDLIAQHIIAGLKNNNKTPYTTFNSSIFTLSDTPNLEKLKKNFDFFKSKQCIDTTIEQREDDVNLAYIAAEHNHTDMLHELAKHKAYLNRKNAHGDTVAHIAAKYGNTEVIKLLKSKRFNFNQRNNNGDTPVFMAAQAGYTDVISKLHKYGADLNQADIEGATPAYASATENHAEIISKLHECNADLNKANNKGRTPAYSAARQGNVEAINTLGECDVDFNKADFKGKTPAFVAAKHNHVHVIKQLGLLKADLNQVNDKGETPAFIAAKKGNSEVIYKLFEYGADLDEADNKGRTPIYIAAKYGNTDVIKALGQCKADLNKAKKNGLTPAFAAALEGHTQVMVELFNQGVNINFAIRISPKKLKQLVNSEKADRLIDIFIKKHSNHTNKILSITPLDIATFMEHKELISYLKKNTQQNSLKKVENLSKKRELDILSDISNQPNYAQQGLFKTPRKRRKIVHGNNENLDPSKLSQTISTSLDCKFFQTCQSMPSKSENLNSCNGVHKL